MNDKEQEERLKEEVRLAPELDFDVQSEPWITIRVRDGAELRLKLMVTGVKRISDDPQSHVPRYFVAHETKLRITKYPPKGER